jgi:hypothetical protein
MPTDGMIVSLFADESGLYVGTNDHWVFRSTDGLGRSWQQINAGLNDDWVNALGGVSGTILANTYGSIFALSEFPRYWYRSDSGYCASEVMSLVTHNAVLYCATWGNGIHTSTDDGRTWIRLESSPDNYVLEVSSHRGVLYAIAASTPFLIWWGGQVYKSTDGGLTWVPWGTGILGGLNHLTFAGDHVWGNTEEGIFRASVTQGVWSQFGSGYIPNRNAQVSFDSTIVIGSSGGAISVSRDLGATWTTALLPYNATTLTYSEGRILAGCEYSSAIYESDDVGITWKRITPPLASSDVSSIVIRDSLICAGLSNRSGVLTSFDYGRTWSLTNIGLTNPSVKCLLLTGERLFAGTAGSGVYSLRMPSTGRPTLSESIPPDGSQSVGRSTTIAWQPLPGALSYDFQLSRSPDFAQLDVQRTSIASTEVSVTSLAPATTYFWRIRGRDYYGGHYSWQAHLFTTVYPTVLRLYDAFPNPFNGAAHIRFELPSETEVVLEVYNLIGQKVCILALGPHAPGAYQYAWNAESQSTGVFFVVLRTTESVQVSKILHLK